MFVGATLVYILCQKAFKQDAKRSPNKNEVTLSSRKPNNSQPITKFSWQSCGTKDDVIQVKGADVYPLPIKIPGNLTVYGNVVVKEDISTDLQAQVTISKLLDGEWVQMPVCFHNIGSCYYEDVCALINKQLPKDKPCPKLARDNHIPCHCPIKKGNYTFAKETFPLPHVNIPASYSMLTDGDYQVQIEATKNRLLDAIGESDEGLQMKNQGNFKVTNEGFHDESIMF
ncbi:Ganglioside GM2 activator [Nymphon striatum]|nr:Ganglioside GM2 activator [Nymphon striatum]KAG1672077.1 Ganglioside GM2 activator [Nymphon striatum]